MFFTSIDGVGFSASHHTARRPATWNSLSDELLTSTLSTKTFVKSQNLSLRLLATLRTLV